MVSYVRHSRNLRTLTFCLNILQLRWKQISVKTMRHIFNQSKLALYSYPISYWREWIQLKIILSKDKKVLHNSQFLHVLFLRMKMLRKKFPCYASRANPIWVKRIYFSWYVVFLCRSPNWCLWRLNHKLQDKGWNKGGTITWNSFSNGELSCNIKAIAFRCLL